jgi:hypothetical protein
LSFIRFDPDHTETFSLVLNPQRYYASGTAGITGSINIFPRSSPAEKDMRASPSFVDSVMSEDSLQGILDTARATAAAGTTDISTSIQSYLSGVNAQSRSTRKQQAVDVYRFDPGVTFSSDFLRKMVVRNNLLKHYRTTRPSYQYAYTNYNTLNFFTSSHVPTSSVLLYPNLPSGTNSPYASGSYILTGAFTFDFYINPRYVNQDSKKPYRAGTIFHLSSCYAVSLITGSRKDANGIPNSFRLMLQLSHSADVLPSRVVPGATPTYPSDLIFISDDNSLNYNSWHHAAIRWGGLNVNGGTGSFIIDGTEAGTFVVPSSSVAPLPFVGLMNPDALCVGNYYEGPNRLTASLAYFFNDPAATDEGVINMLPSETMFPILSTFDHPLNAEIHELKIFDSFRTLPEIVTSSMQGPLNLHDMRFYVPPFFMKESPVRKILQSPFFSIQSSTDDPFNVALSFGVNGHLINTHNFTRDLITLRVPRHLYMTASTVDGTTLDAVTANQYLYATASVRRANLLLLPCDNGKFKPNFGLLTSGVFYGYYKSGSAYDKYTNDLGVVDPSLISLTDMIPSGNFRTAVTSQSGSMFDDVVGASPDNLGVDPGEVLTIFQRTRDNSSNEVVFFDVSNLFYGRRIMPGSVCIEEDNLTGSGGAVRISLCDNGLGSLYRANCLTEQAQWNSVGNVFYEDGIIMIKSPHLAMFGKDNYRLSFKGEHAVHTLKLVATAPAGMVNSSSNPTYIPLSASSDANDQSSQFVYITGLNFHDKDLNVVMRTALAQPAVKRESDKLTFHVRLDF